MEMVCCRWVAVRKDIWQTCWCGGPKFMAAPAATVRWPRNDMLHKHASQLASCNFCEGLVFATGGHL